MKVFVKYTSGAKDKARVTIIDYRPDLLSEEELQDGIVIDYEEAKEVPSGKQAVLYVNPLTGLVWYELEDRPLSQEELIRFLQKELAEAKANAARIADIELALAELFSA
ncbi:hypothetical protein ACWGPW_06160 [Paenibacillus chitinolyticus]|uniref:hypothetical protein n=1 Tax=Paenibacillus chitinolyticus TaxID=79263 RepID=UPI0035D9B1EC